MSKTMSEKPLWTKFFSESEVKPLSECGDFEGKVMILKPEILDKPYRKRKFLLWQATGGFGCSPSACGRAVYADCLGDKEHARWDRHDFVGEFIGEL